jgi:hypothetical protein
LPDDEGRPIPEDVDWPHALTPFSAEERIRLERYVVRAERLSRASFWQRKKQSLNVRMAVGEAATVEMAHVEGDDDEALDAMFARLRQLWAKGRRTAASYPRTVAILRDHAISKAPAGQTLLELLDALDAMQATAETSGPGIGLQSQAQHPDGTVTSRDVPPQEAFEDWLYGEFLHDDEERIARIDVFRPHGAHLYVALAVATNLAHVYVWTARFLVNRVLVEDSLFL